MSYNATLVIKTTSNQKKYGVRFAKSKKIVWCKDFAEAARKLSGKGVLDNGK